MSNPLQQFKDDLSKKLYGRTTEEAIRDRVCIACKQDPFPKIYSEMGRREYYISGLCEECFDGIARDSE